MIFACRHLCECGVRLDLSRLVQFVDRVVAYAQLAFAVVSPCPEVSVRVQGERMGAACRHLCECGVRLDLSRRGLVVGRAIAQLAGAVVSPCPEVSVRIQRERMGVASIECLQRWDIRRLLGAFARVPDLHVPGDDAFRIRALVVGDGLVHGGFRIGLGVPEVHVLLICADTQADVVGRVLGVRLEPVRPATRVRHVLQPAVVGLDLRLHSVTRTGALVTFHRCLVGAGAKRVELIAAVNIGLHRVYGLPCTVRILFAEGDFDTFDTLLVHADSRILVLVPPDGTADAAGRHVRGVRPWLASHRTVWIVGIVVAAQP